jgi:hypothetical protein
MSGFFRSPRLRTHVFICCGLLLVASSAGCYRWRPVELGPTPTDNVLVRVGQTETRYVSAMVSGDSVVLAGRDSTSVRIAPSDIDEIEQRHFDWITSIGVGAIIVTGWLCIYPGC